MNQVQTEQARASREASDWLILLQEEPDDTELHQCFETWLQMNRAHRSAWAATRRTTDVLDAAHNASTHNASSNHSTKPLIRHFARPRKRLAWRYGKRSIVQAAAAGLAICLAMVVFAPKLILHLQADHITGSGEIRTVDLADGSRVVLAPKSAIALDFDSNDRQVRLLAGEAVFEVQPAPERAFEVRSRAISTRVLGTVFSVRRAEQGVNVAVVEGHVRVAHADAAAQGEMLTAGDTVQMDWTGRALRNTRLPDDIAAWRSGYLIASDEPVAEVIDRLRPYYSGAILLIDDELAAQTVTGVYSLDDPPAALKAITEAHGAKLRQVSPWLVVISK